MFTEIVVSIFFNVSDKLKSQTVRSKRIASEIYQTSAFGNNAFCSFCRCTSARIRAGNRTGVEVTGKRVTAIDSPTTSILYEVIFEDNSAVIVEKFGCVIRAFTIRHHFINYRLNCRIF